MSNEPSAPQTPTRDDKANEEFGPTESIGDGGYPEEAPDEVQPGGSPDEGRTEQPQRDEG